ncbi:TetR/AcrR family transcriptional regulator [Streptomyces sp. NPDC004647]|uniref:TetR/AcrR family transcriptional regulator n=1 Tax=Streptomyces sp. NPDC004647 TaxID=3154671 RepID=UPI00339F3C82
MHTPSDQQIPPPLRRIPVQQRSAERLARILDACAEVLDETGYESLSTRAVAVRAGVPIGSVYRFFSNKRAMADALAHRNLDVYIARVDERLATAEPLEWRYAIDVVIDVYLAMKRDMAGFARIDFCVPAPAAGLPDHANQLVADRLCDLLAERLGRAPDADLRRTFLIAVEAADALLQLAFRADPSGDPVIIAETKELVRAYLARVLD